MKYSMKRFLCLLVSVVLMFSIIFSDNLSIVSHAEGTQIPTVQYRVHVQSKGWTGYTTQGMSGTAGKALRLEAVQIKVSGVENLGVRYRTHVQTYGWQNYVADGAVSGTTGKSKRMEAIQIELTGANAGNYDIYYRVHVQSFGWMNWAKNGEIAGTEGYGKRMEALEIRILPKGSARPEGTGVSYSKRQTIEMQAHVQSYGWMSKVEPGSILGTTGNGKRLEAITLQPVGYDFDIEYSVHAQSYGWMNYVKNGQVGGTTGQGKRLEAVKIRLSGKDADKYDIYYRAHVQGVGWLDWAKNDEIAGSTGLGLRMEALEVKLVSKGEAAPGATTTAYLVAPGITYSSYVQSQGWQNPVSAEKTSGTTGKGLALQSLRIQTEDKTKVGIRYSVYENGAWTPYAYDGQTVGAFGMNIEAVKIELTGPEAKYYNVYYRAHNATAGWLGWASNGQPAGVAKIGKPMQALEIVIARTAPGNTANAYRENLDTEAESYARKKLNEIGWDLHAAFNYSSSMPYAFRADIDVPAGYTNADWYAIFGFQHNSGNCYHMAATFYQMAKMLGYDAYYVQGYLPQKDGSRTTHGWCEIEMDGALYVFDPNFTYWTKKNGYKITYGMPGTFRYTDYKRMN